MNKFRFRILRVTLIGGVIESVFQNKYGSIRTEKIKNMQTYFIVIYLKECI